VCVVVGLLVVFSVLSLSHFHSLTLLFSFLLSCAAAALSCCAPDLPCESCVVESGDVLGATGRRSLPFSLRRVVWMGAPHSQSRQAQSHKPHTTSTQGHDASRRHGVEERHATALPSSLSYTPSFFPLVLCVCVPLCPRSPRCVRWCVLVFVSASVLQLASATILSLRTHGLVALSCSCLCDCCMRLPRLS
jgi:hypothetical protein